MATSSTYCTHRDIEDIYPNINDFDSKEAVYGWATETISGDTYYVAYNSGLMTQLFIDGKSQQSGNQKIGTTKATDCIEPLDASEDELLVQLVSPFTNDTFIKIDDEIMYLTSASADPTNNITVTRGVLGTTATTHVDNSGIFLHFQPASSGDNLYDADNDFIIIKYSSDPNDNLTESGEDFSTLITRTIKNASRYLDSRLDASLPRDQFKDKEGNFDYIIIRTTALISTYFLLNAHTPGSEPSNNFLDEINFNIEQLNMGHTRLSGNVSGDAHKGIIREVLAPQNSNGLHIVDTRGQYSGIYDLIKVIVSGAGAIGTGTFNVFVKSSSGLKSTQVVTDKIINGQYQTISGGLQIRFSGKDDSSTATVSDEWEIEVHGYGESMDDNIGTPHSVKATRRDYIRKLI